MATKVIIPHTGEKETTGTIGIWFKHEGERVNHGEPLCTIETDKASLEIQAPCAGVLRRIFFPRDSQVSVGDCVAIIGDENEDIASLEEEILRK
jgi:pyruvate/2-oxoglutarate dehydrogenase complex dihydrolipoamide acyltransferase (E2) component